jgi:hypothetical protein
MTTKKVRCLVLFLAFMTSLAFSTEPPEAQKGPSIVAFNVGDFFLSPQVLGVSAGSEGRFALGANAEYFLSKTIAVGGDVSFYLKSPGGLSLFPDIEYHFNVNVQSLDVYIGAGPSLFFGFGTDGETLFGGKAFGAARYFFNPSTGVFLKLGFASNKNGTAGIWAIGVSFKL